MGAYVPVNAQISTITSLSAHADQLEILGWLSGFSKFPKQIFLVHGEANALEGLRVRIKDAYKVEPHIAKLSETVALY
jgi:metallo-beta-lactamase family protein